MLNKIKKIIPYLGICEFFRNDILNGVVMKVRIQGNSIRFRLKEFEVAAISEKKLISEELTFSNDPAGKLSFTLKASDLNHMQVFYSPGKISVSIPADDVLNWAQTDQVGIQSDISLQDNLSVSVLIEKDFRCLDRKDEDEVGSYPNPNKVC